MTFFWTWWGVPGTVAMVAAWICAFVALRTDPRRSLNRSLSVVLILEGTITGGIMGLLFFFENPSIVFALATIGTAAFIALCFQYLSFLGLALDTPLVALFRTRIVIVLLGLASVFSAVFVFVNPDRFISDLYDPGWAPWNFQYVDLGLRMVQLQGFVMLFGLFAAITAFIRTTKGTVARSKAKWFIIAFGFRDIYLGVMQLLYPVLRPVPFWGDLVYNTGSAFAFFIYFQLLAYAVLRFQLFEIDLKLKFALQQSTVGAIIVGGFVVGSEALELLVPVDGPLPSFIVAIVILALLRPIQRLALGMANGLMRNVQDSPEYKDRRKVALYRAALEEIFLDGDCEISRKERRILDRLRMNLQIAASDALLLERELNPAYNGIAETKDQASPQ